MVEFIVVTSAAQSKNSLLISIPQSHRWTKGYCCMYCNTQIHLWNSDGSKMANGLPLPKVVWKKKTDSESDKRHW
ncbi:hypothetical protein HNY73_004632 [Argiope bruennichi]|uniref:Uncharacterized protein n=1 Tax=Argiope bruennichi TaxID=94029 RepID=A0A8T0FSF0_ARGBR|nr:hypothetical protein HNY73_004632 [Argiope bruennichi]